MQLNSIPGEGNHTSERAYASMQPFECVGVE
jgi:hypothetical protein